MESAERYPIMRGSGSLKSRLLIALQGQVCPETVLGQVPSQLQGKETCQGAGPLAESYSMARRYVDNNS